MSRLLISRVVVVAATMVGMVVNAGQATANDWGGSGPSVSQCSYGAKVYTPSSARVRYPSGADAGYVEIKWSDWCPTTNWAQLTSNIRADRLSISIHEPDTNPHNAAGADDYNASRNWTPALKLVRGASSRVCAYADIYTKSGRASGVTCAG